MNPFDWLKLAVPKLTRYPALRYIHGCEIFGVPAQVAADGNVAHFVFYQPHEAVPVLSSPIGAPLIAVDSERWQVNFQKLFSFPVFCRCHVNALSLSEAVKQAESVYEIVTFGYWNENIMHIGSAEDGVEFHTCLYAGAFDRSAMPFRFAFDPVYLMRALKYFHTKKRGQDIEMSFFFDPTRKDKYGSAYGVILGIPGVALAILMGMTTNVGGLSINAPRGFMNYPRPGELDLR